MVTRRRSRPDAPIRRAGRRSWSGIALVTVLVGGLLASPWLRGRWSEWTTSLRADAEAVDVESVLGTGQTGDEAAALLVVVTDESGRGASFAILTADEAGAPLALLVPAPLFVTLPGYGEFQLADAPLFEDASFAGLVLTNATGLRFDTVALVGPDEMTAVIGGELGVGLRSDYVIMGDTGETLVAAAGSSRVDAATATMMLIDPGGSDVLGWVERQAAVWDAVLGAAVAAPQIAERLASVAADPAEGKAAVAAALGASVTLIPVDRTGAGGDADGFVLDTAEADSFMAARLGGRLVAAEPRPRLELLNGNGRLQGARGVAEVLIGSGFRVVRTDNAVTFDYDTTLVIAQGRDNILPAQEVVALLGLGAVELELRAPSSVVDLSIIVGHDVPEAED